MVKLYRRAGSALKKHVLAYFKQFEAQDAEKRRRLDAGEITKEQFTQWRREQITTGQEFKELRNAVALAMLDANQEATAETDDAMPDVFVVNYQQEAEEIEQEEGAVLPLLSAAAIAALLLRPRVKKRKDLAWNRRNFSAAVSAGLGTDKPLRGVCVEALTFTVKRNRETAHTNLRTFLTSAETRARQTAYSAADALGVHRMKTWHAVHDDRVRDAHAAMDGVSVPWTEKFIVDGYEMDGPGDQSAPPRLWYNCRCRMKSERVK